MTLADLGALIEAQDLERLSITETARGWLVAAVRGGSRYTAGGRTLAGAVGELGAQLERIDAARGAA